MRPTRKKREGAQLGWLSRRAREARAQEASAAPTYDGGVISAVLILASMGIVMIYSTTATLSLDAAVPPHFLRQSGALLVGGIAAMLAANLPVRTWRACAYPLWAFSVALLVVTLLVGTTANGAQRWLGIPGTSVVFQPAEIAKFATVLAVAAVLARRDGRSEVSTRRLFGALALGMVPAGLLVLQPDLGNAVLIGGLVGLMLFTAGVPLRILATPAALGAVAVGFYIAVNSYALDRVRGFLDPWATAHQQGYQLVQSFVAFGRGGTAGVGVGGGLQKLSYLPEAHTDFILAVIAEELGLLGVLLVLGGFAALLIAGARIALRSQHRFTLLVAFGMTLLLVVPALINGAVVMGLVPTKGLTLPFLSYGRSSLVVSFLAVGVILSIGRTERGERPAHGVGRAEPRGILV